MGFTSYVEGVLRVRLLCVWKRARIQFYGGKRLNMTTMGIDRRTLAQHIALFSL
jgi:hypothetical protein